MEKFIIVSKKGTVSIYGDRLVFSSFEATVMDSRLVSEALDYIRENYTKSVYADCRVVRLED